MDITEEYAIFVINTQKPQGQTVYALASSLFHKLSKIMTAKNPSLSVSIYPDNSESQQNPSYSIRIESPRKTQHLILKEFLFPVTLHPSTKAYLFWISRSAIRAWVYLWHRVPEIWHESAFIRNKISGLRTIIGEIVVVIIETVIFVYMIPFITLTLIPSLRKIGNLAFVSYFFLSGFAVLLLTWSKTLPPLIMWVSQLSRKLVELTSGSGLTFEILFPIVAATFFTVLVTVVTILVRIARWVISNLDSGQEVDSRIMSELSYLFDPLYAAKVRDDFERQLINSSKTPNLQRIFIICDGMGALLSYEVLSHNNLQSISVPVSLLTHHLYLAGLFLDPVRSLWLLVDPEDWGRFSKTTPKRLQWWHYRIGWPKASEYAVRLTSRLGYRFPWVKRKLNKHLWFKGADTIFADRLAAKLLRLAKS